MIRWTDELVINESKKFKTRTEFARKSNSAYKYSKRHNLIDEFYWLSKFVDDRPRCVYAYVDEDNKVAYIGLTVNKQLRHLTHSTGKCCTHKKSKSPVYDYFSSIKKDVPNPIYLEDNLSITDARELEDFWIHIYEKNGYSLLNKGKTGKYSGSIGLHFKWNKETAIEESKKYTNKVDFKKNSPCAYEFIRKHKLFNETPWINDLQRKPWTKDEVFKESHKYSSKNDFSKNSYAYVIAVKNNWINEMTWLKRPKNYNFIWSKEKVFEESRKYSTKSEFNKNNSSAYNVARKNGWLQNMTWLHQRLQWNYESAYKESQKYHSRSEFKKNNRSAFDYIYKHNMLDEIAHLNGWK